MLSIHITCHDWLFSQVTPSEKHASTESSAFSEGAAPAWGSSRFFWNLPVSKLLAGQAAICRLRMAVGREKELTTEPDMRIWLSFGVIW